MKNKIYGRKAFFKIRCKNIKVRISRYKVKRKNQITFNIFAFSIFTMMTFYSCTFNQPAEVVSHQNSFYQANWSQEEKERGVAERTIRKTDEASYHFVRLNVSEKPHVHYTHDLVVFILSGTAKVHLGDQTFEAKTGDVVEIPRGNEHWAEIIRREPCELYAIFSPPFDGQDTHFIR